MTEEQASLDPCQALTVKAAAALLQISEPTMRAIIRRGDLPSLRIGRCRRIRRADLAAFLAERVRSGWQAPRPGATGGDSEEDVPDGEDIEF